MPARTLKISQTSNPCPICMAEGVSPLKYMKAQVEQDSSGVAEMLVMKCDTHGPVKRLFSARPDPVFKKLFPEFFKEDFGELAPEPKPTTWV